MRMKLGMKMLGAALCLVMAQGACVAVAQGTHSALHKSPHRHVVQKTPTYEIDMDTPLTGIDKIDDEIAATIDKALRDEDGKIIAKDPNDKDTPPYSYEIFGDIVRRDSKMIVISLNITSFYGAHPTINLMKLNYVMPQVEKITLWDIVTGQAGIRHVSDLAIAQLIAQNKEHDFTDLDWIKRGAGPRASNFKTLEVYPNRLEITFNQYQVAPYASGIQGVSIPLSQLKGFLRPNWLAPAASFDCAKAQSATEHAICSDRALAHIDQDVMEAFQAKREYAEPPVKLQILNAQRAWLAQTAAKCGGNVPCLKLHYAARLKALNQLGWNGETPIAPPPNSP